MNYLFQLLTNNITSLRFSEWIPLNMMNTKQLTRATAATQPLCPSHSQAQWLGYGQSFSTLKPPPALPGQCTPACLREFRCTALRLQPVWATSTARANAL